MKYQPARPEDSGILARAMQNLIRSAGKNGAPGYLPLPERRTAELLLPGFPFPDPEAAGDRIKAAVLAVEGENENENPIVGLAAGNASPSSETAYVTVLLTSREGGEGEAVRKELLERLTAELFGINPRLARLRWVFYNPCLLPWRLPHTDGEPARCAHPGAPGVAEEDPARGTLLSDGWRDFAPLTVYARSLPSYEIPEDLARKTAENAALGLKIEEYDPRLHGSLVPLVESLGSEDWRRTLLGNAAAEDPLPVMVAADRSDRALREHGGLGFVCGFAGPMKRTEDGRGWFAGIGIHPAYRSRGLGSTLFAGLCRGLRDLGADYMTLFTGTGGTAARIYEKAGFRPARQFFAMEKILRK